jgi:hypothetical protein
VHTVLAGLDANIVVYVKRRNLLYWREISYALQSLHAKFFRDVYVFFGWHVLRISSLLLSTCQKMQSEPAAENQDASGCGRARAWMI